MEEVGFAKDGPEDQFGACDIAKYLYKEPTYIAHNCLNGPGAEMVLDPNLSEDVASVQRHINEYRSNMLHQIRRGEDGTIDIKELQERVKWRRLMLEETGGATAGDTDSIAALSDRSHSHNGVAARQVHQKKGEPLYYLRTR